MPSDFKKRQAEFVEWKEQELFFMTMGFTKETAMKAMDYCINKHGIALLQYIFLNAKKGTRISLIKMCRYFNLSKGAAYTEAYRLAKKGVMKRIRNGLYEKL